MSLELRRSFAFSQVSYMESGKEVPKPLETLIVGAIIKNPWYGRGFVEDLKSDILKVAPTLGEMLTNKIIDMAGGGDKIEAYGKAAMVGTSGEEEHASALIHTLHFGNFYRKAVGAESYLCFTNVRTAPGGTLIIPLMHKHDAGMRSHYLTTQLNIPDAPAHDEIIVALAGSLGGRPFHRTGDRYQDLKELGDLNATK